MSELACDQNGDPIALPANASMWRVRRFRNPGLRGAPENCLDREGNPLRISTDATFAEFRQLVDGVPGRYRLDPLDDAGRVVPNVPAAYVSLTEPPRNATSAADERDSVIRELARANAEMTKTIAERFASVMQATAELMRVSAALPPRPEAPPPLPDDDEDDDDQEDEDDDERPDLAGLVAELLPTIQLWLSARAAERAAPPAAGAPAPQAPPSAPPPTASASSSNATPSAAAPAAVASSPVETAETVATATVAPFAPAPAARAAAAASATPAEGARNAAVTPAQMAHLAAIQARLTPQEVRVIQAAALRMTPEVRANWLAELAVRSVADAVTLVRSMLPKLRPDANKGGGS